MTTMPLPAAEPQQNISGLGRIIGVLFSPKGTYQDIVRKPTWLLPVAIMAMMGLVSVVALNQRINWRDFIRQQIEKSPRAEQLSEQQERQRIDVGAKYGPVFSYLFGVPGPVVVIFLVTLVMWGAYNLLGGAQTDFKTSLGIVSHAFMPNVIGTLLFLLVLFLKPIGTVDLDNPVATNVAAFLPDGVPKWLEVLSRSVDIFALWILMLIAMGFAATNPQKLKGGKALSIAFTVLAVYVVLRAGWAFIFS